MKPTFTTTLLALAALATTTQADPQFTFTSLNQTISEDFNTYRGTEATLPADIFVEWDTAFTTTPFTGVGDFNTTNPATGYGAFTAYTVDDENFAFGIRERQPQDLRDARVYLPIKNETGAPIRYFLVTYYVETWFNGQRDNRIRLKYDNQIAGGRFEEDLASTTNVLGGGSNPGIKTDGSLAPNRVRVEVIVDLEEYSHPVTGVLGPLPDGQTAWFRWQVSNADIDSGSQRSGLALNDLSITALATPTALQWRPGTGGSGTWLPEGGTDWDGGPWEQGASALFADTAGTITLGGHIDTLNVNLEADYTLAGDESTSLTAPAGINVGPAVNATLAASLADSGDFLKGGPGTLIISTPQHYSGATRIGNGSLTLSASDLLPASAEMIVSVGASFFLGNHTQTVNGLRGERNATVDTGTGTLILANTGYREFRGDIIGSGNLLKIGIGTQRFRSENKLYTGYTRIQEGVLELTENGQLTGTAGIYIEPYGELRLAREEATYASGTTITLEGGALAADADSEDYLIFLDDDIAIEADDSSIYVRRETGILELYGSLSGTGLLRKQGSGELALLGPSTHTGGIDIRNGTVVVDPFATPGASLGTGPLFFTSGSNHRRLELLNSSQTISALAGSVTEDDETGDPIGSATLYLGPGHTLTIDQDNDIEPFGIDNGTRFQGRITGPGSLVKTGTGLLQLTRGPNTFTGSLNIQQGALAVSAAAAPDNASSVAVHEGGQIRLTSGSSEDEPIRTYTLGSSSLNLAGTGRSGVSEGEGQGILGALRAETGGQDNTLSLATPVTLTAALHNGIHISGSSNRLILSGGISGAGALVKTGGGTLEFTGTNHALSADILVLNGTLDLPSGTQSGTGTLHVTDSGRLSGTGTIPGSLSLSQGGTYALDLNASETLTVSGSLTANDGATIHILGATDAGTFPVMTIAGSLTGLDQLNASGLEDTGLSASFSRSDNTLYLILAPDAPSATYSAWAQSYDLPGGQDGPLDNPSGDGIPNLTKYALGLDPLIATTSALPTPSTTEHDDTAYLSLIATVRTDDPTLAVDALASQNLTLWDVSTTPLSNLSQEDVPQGFERKGWRTSTPLNTNHPLFIQLAIIQD